MSKKSQAIADAAAESRIRRTGRLRDGVARDATDVCSIYNHYVERTIATFELIAVPAEEMARRIVNVSGQLPWLVWEQDGMVLGYAYATLWKSRAAYAHSVETTVYLAPDPTGRGIGTVLYRSLLDRLRSLGVHCAVGAIALPNAPSVALHEKLGFAKIGQFHQIGFKFGEWIDVGYWQIKLP